MKDIIELAREAGIEVHPRKQQARIGMDALMGIDSTAQLERFASLVRAQVLEEAAGVCDNSASHCHDDGLLQLVLKSNAAAIRALKEKT